jgi:GT2 family glycosyltransferase
MLASLCRQRFKVHEVIVADGSTDSDIAQLTADDCWVGQNMLVKRISVRPPNAVRQREAAISLATGEYLLFLDDDVVLDDDCTEEMVHLFQQDEGIVGVFANFINQSWPMPTRPWRFYLRYLRRMKDGSWQGRVVGPLLRFAYDPAPKGAAPMDWIGTGNSMVRRSAYDQVGGFSKFFLHRCTMNEDVDLGLKIRRIGKIFFCPNARMRHLHAPGGRASPMVVAEDDLYNRYSVMTCTQQRSVLDAFSSILLYFVIETLSGLAFCVRRLSGRGFGPVFLGRVRALVRIAKASASTSLS